MAEATTEVIGWAILELMGHRRLGGYVRPVEVAGKGFLRIDVPTTDTNNENGPWSATQLYSPDAVYCITPTTMSMAKAAANANRIEPVSRWELPQAKTNTHTDIEDDENDGAVECERNNDDPCF